MFDAYQSHHHNSAFDQHPMHSTEYKYEDKHAHTVSSGLPVRDFKVRINREGSMKVLNAENINADLSLSVTTESIR